MTKKPTVTLHVVDWRYEPEREEWGPYVYSEEAFAGRGVYASKGKYFGVDVAGDAGVGVRNVFKYRASIRESEREGLLIGLTPQEAIDLALELAAKQRQRAADDLERFTHAVLRLEGLTP